MIRTTRKEIRVLVKGKLWCGEEAQYSYLCDKDNPPKSLGEATKLASDFQYVDAATLIAETVITTYEETPLL